jgi:glycosyltransferase involved in cell wall biosynthesis
MSNDNNDLIQQVSDLKKYRLVFLLNQDIESSAAVGRYFPIAVKLASLGFNVKIIGLHPNYQNTYRRRFIEQGVEIIYVGQMHVKKYNNKKEYFSPLYTGILVIKAIIAICIEAIRSNCDIIFVGKPQPINGIAGIVTKAVRRKPLITDCDDYETENNRISNFLIKSLLHFSEKKILEVSDKITVLSSSLIEKYLSIGVPQEKLIYLPHGIINTKEYNSVFLHNKLKEYNLFEKKIIVYAGSISSWSHDLDLLLDSFYLVKQKCPNAILLVVGRGESISDILRKSKHLGVNDSLLYLGWKPHHEIGLYYKIAHVAVDPVKNNPAGRYSVSLKIFDSIAYKTPLVTVDVGDRKKILGDPPCALIVPPDDPFAFSDAILSILSNEELRITLMQRMNDLKQKYSWDNQISILTSIVFELAKNEK